ncbi:Clathrin/coatomer adaptor, adaptin-like protein [Pavlovales sp. CCMP2436]|nr:Clathrin/coatomer adaptor, adaptin-like protein [Pavlovales sp. CCMP2436]
MSGAHLSKDFFELIKNIGECKSKQEEEKIISNEVAALRQRLSESPTSVGLKRTKEAIVRVMYVEMLGQSADFGHIHAVNITQQTNLLCKRVGYLACSLCLHPEHELITLLVNTIRRDLKSSNHLEACAALIAVSKLVNPEIMPAMIECVADLLEHTHEVVRKKAVMALHRLHTVVPGCLESMTDKLRRVLCDKDPAVMGASLHILHALIEEAPAEFKDLVPSFVSILKQITEHRLPSSFDYHRMPAPWIQIKLLKVLGSLGIADQRASEGMYEVLYDVLKRADTGINIGYAVVYECVRTVTTIYPNMQLLETAANHISRFVSSENHNLKYLGIKALASIVQVNQKYALEHQMVVVDCLEDPDETLKRKTLDLLFKMTNAQNVVFVVDKLLLQVWV